MRIFSTRSRRRLMVAIAPMAVAGLLLVVLPTAEAADSNSLLTWTKLAPGTSPPARFDAAMAFDTANDTAVLYGGLGGTTDTTVLGDTWVFDGTAWAEEAPANGPPPLAAASMAYDSVNNRLLLFGGKTAGGAVSSQTWSWDGTKWTLVPQPAGLGSPPARYGASVADDTVAGVDVLFGGIGSAGTALGDTWSWNGSAWTQLAKAPAPAPTARTGAAMTFDAARGDIVLFGGASTGSGGTTSGLQADTWTFDGTNWTQQTPGSGPPARTAAAFGFDLGSGNSILFGGVGGPSGTTTLGDTWLWNGFAWSTSLPITQVPSLNPPARSGASIATEPVSDRVIMFGGKSANPGGADGGALGDTWGSGTAQQLPSATTTTVAGGPSSTPGSTTSTTRPRTSQSSTSTTQPAAPDARPSLLVDATTVHRGDDVRVSGNGFAPFAVVTITLHSVPMVVGTTVADAQGSFAVSVTVPSNAPTGPHQLRATGPAVAGGQVMPAVPLSIIAPSSGNHWLLPLLMVLLTLALAAGAGVVLVASTRWRQPSTS
ncbi:MAG: Kelch repeat-containing protein [Acidimicrobiales bacterium]